MADLPTPAPDLAALDEHTLRLRVFRISTCAAKTAVHVERGRGAQAATEAKRETELMDALVADFAALLARVAELEAHLGAHRKAANQMIGQVIDLRDSLHEQIEDNVTLQAALDAATDRALDAATDRALRWAYHYLTGALIVPASFIEAASADLRSRRD